MSSTLRRLSASLPFSSSKNNSNNTEELSTSSSGFRRKSSTASASSVDNDNNFRSLGARDYKLAMNTNMNAEESESSSSSSNFRSRRKSSTASAISTSAYNSTDTNFRSLGARDYKLAMDPEEEKGRRSSVADFVAEMAAAEGDEEAAMARRGSKGRIFGARDWRLIGKQ